MGIIVILLVLAAILGVGAVIRGLAWAAVLAIGCVCAALIAAGRIFSGHRDGPTAYR
jgi:hypothetical protein